MKPILLSGLIASGVINKKDRILCYRDAEGKTLAWLRRQRFNAEGPFPERKAHEGLGARGSFDIVMAHWPHEGESETGLFEGRLHEALAQVRPGGNLLLFREVDSLFSEGVPENAEAYLANLIPDKSMAGIEIVPPADSGPASICVIRKAGAYTPRMPVVAMDDATRFQELCERLLHEAFVALDVETTLREPRILCTVQLATESEVYVIDMLPMRDLRPLKELMESKSVTKIIHNKAFEEKVLGGYGIKIVSVYDTLIESRKRHKYKGGGGHKLGEVCERELGIYLDKGCQTSDWTRRPLSREQMDYAAADAEVLIRLYRLFVPPKKPETLELF